LDKPALEEALLYYDAHGSILCVAKDSIMWPKNTLHVETPLISLKHLLIHDPFKNSGTKVKVIHNSLLRKSVMTLFSLFVDVGLLGCDAV
jgi:hypothetical protein